MMRGRGSPRATMLAAEQAEEAFVACGGGVAAFGHLRLGAGIGWGLSVETAADGTSSSDAARSRSSGRGCQWSVRGRTAGLVPEWG